jgi:hypothetical protein
MGETRNAFTDQVYPCTTMFQAMVLPIPLLAIVTRAILVCETFHRSLLQLHDQGACRIIDVGAIIIARSAPLATLSFFLLDFFLGTCTRIWPFFSKLALQRDFTAGLSLALYIVICVTGRLYRAQEFQP